MQSRRRKSRNRSINTPKVSLTPLIDTALTLLIIFMITAPMMTNIIKVELPSSRANEGVAHEQQEFIVSIDKSKNLYLNAQKMSMDLLIKKLQKEIGKEQNAVVFVQADQGVSYGQVIDVVDTLKTVGELNMLRWPQNKPSKKVLFFREIIVFVLFLHFFLIVFCSILVSQKNKTQKFSIRPESRTSSTIVFLPLKKYVDPGMNKLNKKNSVEKHKSRKVIDYQSYVQKQAAQVGVKNKKTINKKNVAKTAKKLKTPPNTAKKSLAKKSALKSDHAKKTVIADTKAATKKTVLEKKTVKADTTRTDAQVKKSKSERVKSEKNLVPQTEEIKQKVTKPAIEKLIEKLIEKPLEKDFSKQPVNENSEIIIDQNDLAQNQTIENTDLTDVVFVGYRELDALQMQSKVQYALEQSWSPPMGMPAQTVCELQVIIEKQGKVVEARVIKSSKIIAFDLAARSAIYKTNFPQEIWGKQITIELGI